MNHIIIPEGTEVSIKCSTDSCSVRFREVLPQDLEISDLKGWMMEASQEDGRFRDGECGQCRHSRKLISESKTILTPNYAS